MTITEFEQLKPGDIIVRLNLTWMIVTDIYSNLSGFKTVVGVILHHTHGLPSNEDVVWSECGASLHVISKYSYKYEKVHEPTL